MADFAPAYEKTIVDEGGYQLATVKGDRGGMTYAGISRVMNPQWAGWAHIDQGKTPPTDLVRAFYWSGFWEPIQGDAIESQDLANALFKFAVNTSAPGRPAVAIKVMQLAARVTPDGELGPKTLAAINAFHQELLLARFTIGQIARHTEICNRDHSREQARQFLLGWNNRDLKGYPL